MRKIFLLTLVFFANPVFALSEEEILKAIVGTAISPAAPKAINPPKGGKARVELENNENFKIERDYAQDAQKSAGEKAKEEAQQYEKEKQFKAFYKKDKKCYEPAYSQVRIECANEYMRAKAKFEALYKQGKIKPM